MTLRLMDVNGSPKLHGSRSFVSPAECALIKGEKVPICIHRVKSSPSGSPLKPPISVPQNGIPDTDSRWHCMFPNFKCSQEATLSPVQTDEKRCTPEYPALVMVKGRLFFMMVRSPS